MHVTSRHARPFMSHNITFHHAAEEQHLVGNRLVGFLTDIVSGRAVVAGPDDPTVGAGGRGASNRNRVSPNHLCVVAAYSPGSAGIIGIRVIL